MKHTGKWKESEVRALLKLANQLHAAPDPLSRKHWLLEGLCQLVGGEAGACVVEHRDSVSGRQIIVSRVEHRRRGACGIAGASPASSDGKDFGSSGKSSGKCALISRLNLPHTSAAASLLLRSSRSHRRGFTHRQRRLIRLFHTEMMWVYQADAVLISPDALTLSPRERETLEQLLAGHSEKQIAAQLQLSRNTVHHYVKSIHKHFGVSTRSELLARWVGRNG